MTAFAASAPGKIILLGEHAVVYGRPAIAVPVSQVQAKSTILANPTAPPGQVDIDAPGIGLKTSLDALPPEHPLALNFQGVMDALNLRTLPALRLRITSTIPIAAGLGSGAAVSVSITRALSAFLGHPLSDEEVNAIAFRVDQAYHGTPSGIDNTVITYAQPIYFLRAERMQRFIPLVRSLGEGEENPELLAMLLDDFYQETFHAPVVPVEAEDQPRSRPSGVASHSGSEGGRPAGRSRRSRDRGRR